MKLKKNMNSRINNNKKLRYIDTDITMLYKAATNSPTVLNNIKSLASLNSTININKFKYPMVYIKQNCSCIEPNNISKLNNELKKLKQINSNNNRGIFKKINLKPNPDINLLNLSHSLRQKTQVNNSLNFLGVTNLKENNSLSKDKSKNNNKNKTKFAKTGLLLRKKLIKNKINKNKSIKQNKTSILNKSEEFLNKKSLFGFLREDNRSNNFNNYNFLFSNYKIKNRSKKELNLKEDELTKDEISLLMKKVDLMLEEKLLYKKKNLDLIKENKKLKEQINRINKERNEEKEKYNKELINIYEKNNEIIKENKDLKNEILILKSKLNELIQTNQMFKEKIESKKFNYIDSFCSSFGLLSLPTTERFKNK